MKKFAIRVLSWILCAVLVFGLVPGAAAAEQEKQARAGAYTGYQEEEPNDSYEEAKGIFNGAMVEGSLGSPEDRDLYKIDLLSWGTVEIIALSTQDSLTLGILDGEENAYGLSQKVLQEDGSWKYTVLDAEGKSPLLQSGTYYITVVGTQEGSTYSLFYNWSLSRDHVHRYLYETVTPATCVSFGQERGTCLCGDTTNRTAFIDPENHPNVEDTPEQPATCTSTGLKGGTQCADCGAVVKAPEETEKLPHEYEAGICIHCGTDKRESGDFLYRIHEDGQTITIAGYTGSAEELMIPGQIDGYTVTAIGENAFDGCESLTAVTVPDGVAVLENSAFQLCTNLVSVTLPTSLKAVGAKSFFCCTKLPAITVPDSVESIGQEAFAGCTALQSVEIGSGVKQIGEEAFKTWTMRLDTQIRFLGNAPEIHSKAFRYLTAKVYYPAADRSWKEDMLQNYGGILTWEPYGDPAPACDHSNTVIQGQSEPTCGEPGYTGDVYCTDCDVILTRGEGIPVVPHSFEKGICGVCGAEDPDYVPETFSFVGVNMTLGNALDMNFFVNQSDLEGSGHYAVITKHYADGREDKVVTLNQDQWLTLDNLYYFTFSGVCAKEMGDEFQAVIYNAAGEAVSETYTDSIQGYARRMLSKETTEDKDKSLYVEMLNYGTAAQSKFRYDIGNPANSVITFGEQIAYGVGKREYQNQRQFAEGYVGTSLTLESRILFNVVFEPAYITEGSYAVASFVNHNGKQIEARVGIFEELGKYRYVSFDQMSVADRSQLITVTLYDGEGNPVVSVQDTVEGYVARMETSDALYEAIMKFADAAYKYFHS